MTIQCGAYASHTRQQWLQT